MKKVIVRLKGGLGNQLFGYAAARRLALANNAQLVIDDVTGFSRDRHHFRKFALDYFNIQSPRAGFFDRLEPFERYRRGIYKWLSQKKPFMQRNYLIQEGMDFDERVLSLRVKGALYLDGLWQSEGYFKDAGAVIRDDLRIDPPQDKSSREMAERIKSSNALAIHVRWHDLPGCPDTHDLDTDYYKKAVALMKDKVNSPQYFLFSDNPESARLKLGLPAEQVTFVSQNRKDHPAHNRGFDESAIIDFWLMSQCKYFIIANSTFSWWAAWLADFKDKIVVAPGKKIEGKVAWGFKGLIPDQWLKL